MTNKMENNILLNQKELNINKLKACKIKQKKQKQQVVEFLKTVKLMQI